MKKKLFLEDNEFYFSFYLEDSFGNKIKVSKRSFIGQKKFFVFISDFDKAISKVTDKSGDVKQNFVIEFFCKFERLFRYHKNLREVRKKYNDQMDLLSKGARNKIMSYT